MIRMIPAIESNTSPSECNLVRGKALDEAVDALVAKLSCGVRLS
jgi:hypothetical protein